MRQDQSTEQQLTELEAYCAQYNLVHRHRFVDEARSGGSTAGRDAFNRMMDLYSIPDQRPRALLLWNYARFARDIDDAQFNKIRVRQWGILIHSLNDHVPEGDHGRIIEFLIDVANEEKRKQTSIDARRGLKDLVLKYGCVPGTPPRGFKREPVHIGTRRDRTAHIAHRWVPDPDLVPKIKQAFELKATRATLQQIHNETHLYGSLNSYRTFFENKIYIGILQFGDLTVENYCEPMIDLHTWDAVQRILQESEERLTSSLHHPRRQSATYLLSGMIHCARCKSPLWGMSAKQRDGSYYLRYACTRAKRNRDCDFTPIPARTLEGEIIARLHAWFDEPTNLAELLEADQAEQAQLVEKTKARIQEKQKDLGSIRRSIANITSAIGQNGHSKALLTSLQDLETRETQLQAQILQLKQETPEAEPPLTREDILAFSRSLAWQLEGKDPAQVRTVLILMIHKIIVDRRGSQVQGHIKLKKHRSREPRDDEESPDIITVSSIPPPLGAPLLKRSNIPFSFALRRQGRPKKRPR